VPVLVDICRRHPAALARKAAALEIGSNASADREAAKTATPDLLDCHKVEADPATRNVIVKTLRAIDARAGLWPPAVYDLRFNGSTWKGLDPVDDIAQAEIFWSDYKGVSTVATDASAPSGCCEVLAQSVKPTLWGSLLPPLSSGIYMCVADGQRLKNIELSVAVKAATGPGEHGGGAFWRLGEGDYYAIGIDPRDGSLCLSRVFTGRGTELARKDGLKLRAGEWHTLSVKNVDTTIECSIDGIKYLAVKDGSISKAGALGTCVRGDTEVYFDGLRVTDYGPGVQAGPSLEAGFRGISKQGR
jgi:hypothetical protein